MAILTEKSFFYLQPGENRSCAGCHEPHGASPSSLLSGSGVTRQPKELVPAAGPQYKGGLSFMRTVQPVLDRYCIECHGLDKTDGDVDLVHDGQQYPISYRTLVERGDHRLGQKGYKTNESTISRPFEYYSQSNKVAQPDESRILMAPLAKNAGGWGQIDAWKSKNDEGHKTVEALVDACIIRRDNENREGWQPSLECGGGESWVMSAREDYQKRIHGEEE